MASRQDVLNRFRQNPDVSVLIVGAGINGIGTFRDLALQGVDVLMVDKGDFCSGASAASSHMLHGGIRYLENGEFRLVREALHERNRMLRNAPHYAKPLPTTIPIFKWFSGFLNAPLKFLGLRDKPSERGVAVIKIGLIFYDLFTRGHQPENMQSHRLYSREESLRKRPKLNPKIVRTATYYDAWMPYPERICLELLMDAEAASPNVHALNYISLVDGSGDTVTLRDELTAETFIVRPRILINAAGPWIDFANRALRQPTNFIGGTKGSHLVVDHPELHAFTGGHELFFENKDGRITLFFPIGDKVLIGTTDIRIDDPEQARTTDEEIDYMLNLVKVVYPDVKLDRSHIVFHFTGVRPLPSSETSTTGQISRDHSIKVIEPDDKIRFPVLSLVGGKWTSFRAFSEQTADAVLKRLGLPRQVDTRDLPIGGGKGYPRTEAERAQWLAALQGKTGVPLDRLKTLFERYGTYAQEIAAYIAQGQDALLQNHPTYSRREVEFLARREKIVHLDDFLLRRSLVAMLGETTGALLEELAEIISPVLGWSEEQKQAEVRRAADLLQTRHGVSPDKLRLPSVMQP